MRTRIPIILAVWFCALAWAEYVIAAEDPGGLLKQADTYRANKQYDQAEQLYLALAGQDAPEAFTAQKHLTFLYITQTPPQLDKAAAAYQQLLSRFAKSEGLSQAIYEVARKYEDISQKDKAVELFEYNVAQFPLDAYAMRSQTRIVKFRIADANDTAAEAGFNKLLTMFSKQPSLPEEIHYVARKYEDLKRYDKALEVYQYNVSHFASNPYTVHSQVRIVWSCIRDGNDAAANMALDRLVAQYPEEPTLCKEVFKVARKFSEAGNSERARELYQYCIDTWSAGVELNPRQYVVMSHASVGHDAEVAKGIEGLIVDFSDHAGLCRAVLEIGEVYYLQAGKEQLLQRGQGPITPDSPAPKAVSFYQKAIYVWQIVLNRLPEDPNATPATYWIVGDSYYRMGQYSEAIPYLQQVVDKWPKYENAWRAQVLRIKSYKEQLREGSVTDAEAAAAIYQASQELVEKYPSSRAGASTREMLEGLQTRPTAPQSESRR